MRPSVCDFADLDRLHARWAGRARDVWRDVGVSAGQRVLDLGCGPGLATLELAVLVGPAGRVVALDREMPLLEQLRARAGARGLTNIEIVLADFDRDEFPAQKFDLVWMRWVTAFATDPRALVMRAAAVVAAGGCLISQEFGETPEIQQWLEDAELGAVVPATSDDLTTIVARR